MGLAPVTILRTRHSRFVRYRHTGEAPGRPALSVEYKRSTEARELDDDPEIKETYHYYDPLVSVTPPSDPPAHDGTILETLDRRVVVQIHDGAPPPQLMLDVAFVERRTREFNPTLGRSETVDYYDPAIFIGTLIQVVHEGVAVVDNGYPVVIAA